MVKLGIIGLGHMGNFHYSVSQMLPNIKLIGVADTVAKNLSQVKLPKIQKSNNYKDWIDKVDAVIIAVPTKLHYKIAKDCLIHGKHVLLEKPLTKNLKEAEELFDIAKKNNLSLHVGHIERFNGAVQELKKIVNKPYLIESQRIGPFSSRVQNDSVTLDLMIHDLDIILDLVNSPVEEMNMIGSKIKTKTGDIAVVQLRFKNGVLANIVSSRVAQIKKRMMSVHQKDSFIQLDFSTQDIYIHSQTTDSVKVGSKQMKYKQEGNIQRLFVYKENPLKIEVDHFIKSIKTGKKARNTKQDMKALELALELENLLINS